MKQKYVEIKEIVFLQGEGRPFGFPIDAILLILRSTRCLGAKQYTNVEKPNI